MMVHQGKRNSIKSDSAEVITFPAKVCLDQEPSVAAVSGEGFWKMSRARRFSLLQVSVGLCLMDFLVSLADGMLVFTFLVNATVNLDPLDYVLFGMMAVLTTCVFYEQGFYRRKTVLKPLRVWRVVLSWLYAAGLLLLAGASWSAMEAWCYGEESGRWVLTGPNVSWAFVFVGVGVSGFIATRLVWSVLCKHLVGRVFIHGRAIVVGTGPEAETVITRLRDDPVSGLEVAGVLRDGSDWEHNVLCGVAVLGGLEDMAGAVTRSGADTVIVAMPWTEEARIAAALAEAGRLSVETRLAPDVAADAYLRHPLRSVAGQLLLDVRDPPLSGAKAVLKRAEDLVLASVVLLMLSPALLAVALAVKLDSRGPVIFKQPRRGLNNTVFDIYKFRSMHVHAADEMCLRQTMRDDLRITRVGAFLRRHSIDELPQLLNVLRGEMSIVGPRPHALSTRTEGLLLEDAVASYSSRFCVKPGITGWAQVKGWRGELNTREKLERRVEFDLDYVKRWSLMLDLRILWLTLRCVIRDGNAY